MDDRADAFRHLAPNALPDLIRNGGGDYLTPLASEPALPEPKPVREH
jgi:hypothetical protein